MGIYNFKQEDAEAFAIQSGIKTRHRGDQLEFSFCPYCRSTKPENRWTFGISLKTGQFECKRSSCSMKGNMITLSRDFNFSLGRETDAYYRTVDYSHKQYKSFKDKHKQIEVKDAAIAYLEKRGIVPDISRKYEITTRNDNESILVFPFKDEAGDLTFIKYRNIDYKKGEGSKEWCEPGCKPILFGMNHCDLSEDTLIITEGQIDSLSVAMAGYKNAVSVPTGKNGFTWIPYCYDFVNRFRKIVIFGDCENGSITLADEISKRWPTKTRVCRAEDYKGYKDANDILRNCGAGAIKVAIDNAEAPYNSHIKPLAKVKQVDIMAIDKISTGMKDVDAVLDGGFRMGQLAVLTGKRGQGKSTLASMWGIQAINQGFNSFFYSGELPDFMFRNWMDCQITGKFEHTQSENDKLDAWYGDRVFIYDNSIVTDNDEFSSLFDVIEVAIVQNNCKFILLDNLMTALEDDLSTDLYRNQSKFVGNLAALAKRYSVFILLIAHPRKTYTNQLGNDDISGSSNITDKADLVMAYSRPDKEEDDFDPDHKRLAITKNRLTGKLAEGKDRAIHLVYDRTSRRIACHTNEFREMHFSWDEDPYFVDAGEEAPF